MGVDISDLVADVLVLGVDRKSVLLIEWWRGAVRLDRAEGVAEPLCAVGGATSRFQEVTEAQGRVYNSVAEGGAILRREVQRLVQSETFPGERIKGVVYL